MRLLSSIDRQRGTANELRIAKGILHRVHPKARRVDFCGHLRRRGSVGNEYAKEKTVQSNDSRCDGRKDRHHHRQVGQPIRTKRGGHLKHSRTAHIKGNTHHIRKRPPKQYG